MREFFVDRDPPNLPVFHEYFLGDVLYERSEPGFIHS
jgi:hypothetical protein